MNPGTPRKANMRIDRHRMTLTEIRGIAYAMLRETLAIIGVIALLRPLVSDHIPPFQGSAAGQALFYWAILIAGGMLTWLIFSLIALVGLTDRDPVPLPPGTVRPWHYLRAALRRRYNRKLGGQS